MFEVSLRVSLFCHLGDDFFSFYKKVFLVQKCSCSTLTVFVLCNFIMDNVIFIAFIFCSLVVQFDVINKICNTEVCPNILKFHFLLVTVVLCCTRCF